jgi:glycosyltransferase involved in cell wall biosynthesis
VTVLPLGVPTAPAALAPPASQRPYFVMLSTIEPRKNHQWLLRLWQRLVETQGEAAPRLVLIGGRGWENEAVFKMLDRMHGVSRHVAECSGLDDAALGGVLRGARALLSPSLAEGYGLPVAEALALGTPVIASDLPAHREVAAGCAELLDPLDGAAWLSAIADYAAEASPRREAQRQKLAAYRAPSWDAHCAAALNVLREAAWTAPAALAGAAPHA